MVLLYVALELIDCMFVPARVYTCLMRLLRFWGWPQHIFG